MWSIFRKEFLELRQNPRIFGIVIVAPILQLTVLGYAANMDVKNVPIVVADGSRSAESRRLIARFEGSPYFTVLDTVTTVQEIDPFIERGTAWLAIAIPSDYARSIGEGSPARLQVVADGSDANSTTMALGYASNLVAAHAEELLAERAPGAVPVDPRIRVWFNPQLISRDFMVPGVLALLLLVITSNLSSMAIVREREIGTYEQLSVTPLTRWGLIVGKLLPYGLIGMVDVLLVIAVAVLWFEIPLRGSLLLLLAMCAVYLLSTLSLGLLVSTISHTQQQAMMTATFFFLMPMIYLSGFIFPIENMPPVIQLVTYLIPLRYFLVIVRGIFLKGIGLEVLWPQALALSAWGLTALAIAASRARKSLD
ncbi:MAG TPA: ABC transporter permease [Vicinamibacterales bacterium]|nr:ABC transporter permease [Vicinamibacterales bacterium]